MSKQAVLPATPAAPKLELARESFEVCATMKGQEAETGDSLPPWEKGQASALSQEAEAKNRQGSSRRMTKSAECKKGHSNFAQIPVQRYQASTQTHSTFLKIFTRNGSECSFPLLLPALHVRLLLILSPELEKNKNEQEGGPPGVC